MTTKNNRLTAALNAPHTTDRQQTILYAIALFWRQNGYAPAVRELRDMCGLSSTSVVTYHLERLRESGFITYVDGKPRTIRITGKLPRTLPTRKRGSIRIQTCKVCGAPRTGQMPYCDQHQREYNAERQRARRARNAVKAS